MLKELFDTIWSKAVESKPVVQKLKDDARGRLLMLEPDGSYAVADAIPPWQRLAAFSIPALYDCHKLRAEPLDSVVFYNHETISLLFDKNEPREGAFMKLTLTPQAQRVAKIEASERLSQSLAIDLFNVVFPEHSPESCLAALRNIRFGKTEDGNSTIESGKRSLGKQLTAQMVGTVALPTEVKVDFDVFHEIESPMSLEIQIEADAEKSDFRVFCDAGSYKRMLLDSCHNHLLPALRFSFGEEFALIHGAPAS